MKKVFQILLLLTPLSIWAQQPVLTIQNGHQTQIRYAAMSPDNAYIISIDGLGTAILWDVAMNKQMRSFTDAFAAEFAADSRSIFMAEKNGKFRQIDLNGKPMNSWSLTTPTKYDGWNRWFFPESGNLVLNGFLYNFKTGKSQRFYAKQWGVQQGFSPEKNVVGIGAKGFLTLSDGTDGHQIREIPLTIPKDQSPYKVEFSRDGNLVLVGEKSIYQLIDASTGSILQTFNHNYEAVFGATFSADGKKAIIAGTNNFYVWNVQTGTLIKKIAHDCSKNSTINLSYQTEETFKLSPDGRKILYAGGYPMRLEVFNAETLALERKFESVINGGVETLYMSNDSKTLSVKAHLTQLLHWNLTTGALDKPTEVPLTTIGTGYQTLSYDAKTYLTAGPSVHSIKETDAYTGELRGDLHTDDQSETSGIYPISFSYDNKYVLAVTIDASNASKCSLRAWEYPSRKEVMQKACSMETMALGNKSNIAVIKENWNTPLLKVIEVPSGKVLGEFDSYKKVMGSVSLKFSNNDKLLAIAEKEGFQIIDFTTKMSRAFCKIPSGYMTDYTFSPDDKYLIAGTAEGNAYIFNTLNGQLESTLRGHTGGVESVKFLKNSKFVFIDGRGDNQIKVWNFRTKELAATLYGLNKEGDWAVTCPDGRFDATKTAMKSMYFVKDLSVTPLESLFEKFYTPNLLPRILGEEKLDPIPVDVNTLKDAPTVKISLENQQRNLIVDDDIPAYSVDKEQITLKVQADCPSDAVTEIRLFQNGKLVQTTRNLVVEDENTGGVKSMTKTFTVILSDGENRFKAIAFNTQRTESPAAEMILNLKKPKVGTPNTQNTEGGITLHLVVIGINKYKNPKYNLNYATADATSFKEAIEKGGAIFSKTNIVFIGDEKATKEGISTELEKIKTVAKPQDVLIFYYAGHGVLNEKKEFYLVPHDVTQLYGQDDALAQKGLSTNQLQQFSKDIKAQKQLFILDACQSAGALDQIVAARGAAEEKAIAQLARATGTHWLTASGSEQFASEFKQLGHGTFTYVLLEALSGKADKGGDKKITVKELDAYLQEQVPEVTAKYKGTPQYPASYGYGNDFPIGVVKQ
jgi:WD40 repeat protein